MTTKLLFSALAGLLFLPAYGAVPFQKGKTPPRLRMLPKAVMAKASEQRLLSEDFSKFSGGSEDKPGDEIEYENEYHIPASLTAMEGWTGGGIFPCAGSIALMDRKGLDQLGFISTPAFDLAGTATLTFRARILPGSEKGNLWVALCDDYYGPGDDSFDVELTPEWKEYTLVASNGSLEEPSYFQFQAEDGYVQIDDITIDFKRDRIAAPYPMRAINNSPTEFTARWEDSGAPAYLLSVICKEIPSEIETGSITESFDNIKVNADGKTIDTSSPNYPAGWEINLSKAGSRDVATDTGWFNSDPLALHFDEIGDTIISPTTPLPIDGVTFWVRPSVDYEEGYDISLLRMEIFHSLTGQWETIGQLPCYYFNPKGGFYAVTDPQVFGDDAIRVRLSMLQKGQATFFVDDFTLRYSTHGSISTLLDDFKVEATEYKVTGINPANEYTYFVKAIDGDLISSPSHTIWVDGVEGLQPEALPASNVTADYFTANWKPLGHADSYQVETYKVVNADADMSKVVINEESFDAITSAGNDWVSPFNYADHGMANTAWCSTQPIWRPGMAGTQGTSWIGAAGLVFSPYLNLSSNNNEGFYVDATVVTTVASAPGYDGSEIPEGMFVMILNSPYDSQALCSAYFETPEPGSHTASVFVPNPDGVDLSNVIVAFMNTTGTEFYVDHVKIMQDLRAGEQLTVPYSVTKTSETSADFAIEPGFDYAYRVTASAYHNYENYTSLPSELIEVKGESVGVGSISGNAGEIAISTGAGSISVNAPESTPVAVFSANGVMMANGLGSMTAKVIPGIYVVKVGDKTSKVAVK